MRIVQLIDSLDVGGAERMAVNYANALSQQIAFSGLAATRKEGALKEAINKNVGYIFLDKKKTIDFPAVFRLKAYCKKHKVMVVHAHGSSFFTAALLKFCYPKIRIVWHDHNGDRDNQTKSQNKALWFCARFFSGIVVVNHRLKSWAERELGCKNVLYLPNFTVSEPSEKTTTLHGIPGKRILYVANLRYPKNHALVLDVAIRLRENHPEWSFHFVGNDLEDAYSQQLKETIERENLSKTAYIYGLRTDTAHIISQADICILSSSYEGLPVALLEYGLHGKPVVATAVGEIPRIISSNQNGLIVPSEDAGLFCNALVRLIEEPGLREKLGAGLYETIMAQHSEKSVLSRYLNWLENK